MQEEIFAAGRKHRWSSYTPDSTEPNSLQVRRLKMEYPGGKNQHFRHLLFFAFHRGQKAAEAARDICNVCHRGASSTRTATWSDEDHLKALLKEYGRQTTRELAEKMKCSAVTISNHL
ncbi:hypothetical protein LAZ67_9002681 [Cordylochernes scorpioides]|uniref:Mos1 transposase HTH domain-containing protein n=1 Tax=Cordylochernes scorpioides TaxID=51811 RepID=A0ABY6KUG1_9ARAC|nr:hypothetical protein LAZ67_9002681 [Cordylochernes scorpioides]